MSNADNHGHYKCKGWYLFLKNDSIEVRDGKHKIRMVVKNLPIYDMKAALPLVPLVIDVGEGKVILPTTTGEPEEDAPKM